MWAIRAIFCFLNSVLYSSSGAAGLTSSKHCSFGTRQCERLTSSTGGNSGMRTSVTVIPHFRHILVHSGEKPHKCGECGKAFALRGSLSIHKLMHFKERPYKCVECGRAFADQRTLGTHKLIRSIPERIPTNVTNVVNHSLGELIFIVTNWSIPERILTNVTSVGNHSLGEMPLLFTNWSIPERSPTNVTNVGCHSLGEEHFSVTNWSIPERRPNKCDQCHNVGNHSLTGAHLLTVHHKVNLGPSQK